MAALVALGVAFSANAQDAKNYVGASASIITTEGDNSINTYGVRIGREFSKHVLGEITYDYSQAGSGFNSGNLVFGNAIGQYRIPGTIFTPYVLAGVGYGTDRWNDRALYNVGGGLRTEITKNAEFDVRFRHVRNFENFSDNFGGDRAANLVTAGLNFKF
jgi:hypothetical protein